MSSAQQSTENPIEAALRQAEMRTMQMTMELRFRENMAMFEKVAPDLYEQYIHYEAKELRLSWDKDGYLNLVNYQLNNKPVYPCDPSDFCKQQVDEYVEKPQMTAINFGVSKVPDPRQIHPRIINELISESKPYTENIKPSCLVPIPTMLMCGVGLGYQIPMLIEKTNIKNLVIFDPHKDSFYASLHVLDWRPILEYFCKDGRMIKLLIGATTESGITDLKLLSDRIGLHKLVYTYVYRHFNSAEETAFYERYRKEFHIAASGTGYLDDEQNGIAHTLANLRKKVPLFKHSTVDNALPPLFLIGNGPSLDMHIELLKTCREKVILMSCGTALSSLEKVGIKPDFHIEMERNYNLYDWITYGTTPEFRKGITLLCLNTVSPAVIDLFDDACMAKKANDIGQKMINDTVPGMGPLLLCNPTVTNSGLAYATAMGFTEIYLIGVDLGTPDEKHHSALSIYHDVEKQTNRKDVSVLADKAKSYTIKGNFSDTVESNIYLDTTRVNMELLISQIRPFLPNLKIYNSNHGAYIAGTERLKLEDIQKFESDIEKSNILNTIKQRNFVSYQWSNREDNEIKETYLKDFFDIRKSLMLPKDIRNADELYDLLHKKLTPVLDRVTSNNVTTMLLRGSLQGYFSLMMKCCLFQKDKKTFKESYFLVRKKYIEFLNLAYEKMENDPFKPDDNPDAIIKQTRALQKSE